MQTHQTDDSQQFLTRILKGDCMKNTYFIIITLILSFCGEAKDKIQGAYNKTVSGVEVTDENVVKYVAAVKALREIGPDIPKKLAEREEKIKAGMEIYSQIEETVKKAGFKDAPEFMKLNAKIAWAWNVSQGETGMHKMETMKDEGLAKMDAAINNPATPESAKEELKKAREVINQNWEKNRKYAEMTLKFIRPFTNEKDLEVIKKHQKELMEAYSGLSLKSLNEINASQFLNKE